jgi:pimeloyl-ACP methyl ester carboxylesterase
MSEPGVQVELVKAVTADGLRLDGAWQPATVNETAGLPAVLCLHGAGSNFYAGGLFERLSETLRGAGYPVLRVNTRGHDGYFVARTSAGGVRLGVGYEIVDQCRLDIQSWLEWLAQRSHDRVAVVGHSLGAIKAVYFQAHAADARVAAVVALSPPRLSYRAFQAGASDVFGPTLRQARRMAAEGRGQEVLESTFPFPMLIAAEAFLDKYGGEKYNIEELIGQAQGRITFVFGRLELENGGVAFAGLPEALRDRGRDKLPTIRIVEEADHFYTGRHEALATEVLAALRGQ